MKIRKLELTDIELLQKIAQQTFIETFSDENSEENLQKYLKEELSIEKLNNEVAVKDSEFYFAEDDNDIVGYLKLNFADAQTELKDDKAVEIERIYVLKEYHGKKVGQLLYEFAVKIAIEKNANYIWLGVWEQNQRAINFYRKYGFVEFDKHTFKLGDDEQIDIMMKLELKT